MKIKYLSGPKAGQIEHVQNQVGGVVCGAGLAEEVSDGAVTAPNMHSEETYRLPRPGEARIPEPVWDVVEVSVVKPYLAIQMTIGAEKFLYAGRPEHVNARKEWQGGGRYLNPFGRAVPEEIVKRYAKAYRANRDLCIENQPMNSALAGATGSGVQHNKMQAEMQAKLVAATQDGKRLPLNRPSVLVNGDDSEVIWEGSPQ
jgi:hypothetical protein